MLFLEGVYVDADAEDDKCGQRFQTVKRPSAIEMSELTNKISFRIARYLERAKLIERDAENCYLTDDALGDNEITKHQGNSIQYRIAVGPHAGEKVFSIKTLSAVPDEIQNDVLGKVDGFSLHAGVAAKGHERSKLERLCRYISRPAVSEQRLSLTESGKIRYELKTPYRNGTTHIIFEPLDFISKLAALVPVPRVNLTRYHGIFAHQTLIVQRLLIRQMIKSNTHKQKA